MARIETDLRLGIKAVHRTVHVWSNALHGTEQRRDKRAKIESSEKVE